MFPGGKGCLCIGLTTLPPSCADCLEIWEPQPSGSLVPVQACNGIALPLLLIRATSLYSTLTHPISLRRISTLFSNLSGAVLITTKRQAGRERIRVWFSPRQDQYLL